MQERLLGWNFPPEHSNLVHPHWRGYLAPQKYWHLSLALVYMILLIFSTVGNGCVVWIFSTYVFSLKKRENILKLKGKNIEMKISLFIYRSKSLKTPSNMFIVNLAVFDIVMLLEIPMLLVNSFLERTVGWELGCDIYAVLGSVSGIGSAITNAAIAFDRYRLVFICPYHQTNLTKSSCKQ